MGHPPQLQTSGQPLQSQGMGFGAVFQAEQFGFQVNESAGSRKVERVGCPDRAITRQGKGILEDALQLFTSPAQTLQSKTVLIQPIRCGPQSRPCFGYSRFKPGAGGGPGLFLSQARTSPKAAAGKSARRSIP